MTSTEQLAEALRDARAAIRATHIHSTALDIINEALAAYEASKASPKYRCPVCGIADENAYLSCNWGGCPDGRDPRPSRATPAQGQDIEGLVEEMAKILCSATGRSWTSLIPKGQERMAGAVEGGLGCQVFWLNLGRAAVLAVQQKLIKPISVRKYVPLPFDAEVE